ncbi:MAG: hypothetical protein GXO79_13030 [Chlorobi bacterium]|nr:hypothetical protein [Chlorobiota bacterium]
MKFKYYLTAFALFVLINLRVGYSQDLYNLNNSLKYADYLYKSHEFNLAANEYERVLFIDSTNNLAAFRLVESYRKSALYSIAINRLEKYNVNINTMSHDWAKEYVRLLILNQNYALLNNYIQSENALASADKIFYSAISDAYTYNWDKAKSDIKNNSNPQNKSIQELKNILSQQDKLKYKSVPLAIALSAIVPGTGKIYSGFWKDGLFSLLVVGVSGLQAYRGFQKNGISSKYGWIYLTMGTGFYIGNIYGTGKAVNKRNSGLNHKIIHQIEDIFNRY